MIDGSGQLTIQGVGTAIITATKAASGEHKEVSTTYLLTVNRGTQSPLMFAQAAITLAFVANDTTGNEATGGSGDGTITYTIDTTSVATIDESSGTLTLKGAGGAIITATKDGGANYYPTSITYILTVTKGTQSPLTLAQSSITINYDETSLSRSNKAIGGSGGGAISYAIDTTNTASINKDSGDLTIKRVGTAIITVTKAGDADYNPISTTYLLTVNKGTQAALTLQEAAITAVFSSGTTIAANTVGGGSGKGGISYAIDKTEIATINSDGVHTIKGVGTATVTVTKEGDANYKPTSVTYTFIVEKNDGILSFVRPSITVDYPNNPEINPLASTGFRHRSNKLRY